MAFDMYMRYGLFTKKEQIHHHEEFILQMMEEGEYPDANFLWENFYNGPKIDPEMANRLVHELLEFRSTHENHSQIKSIKSFVDRLVVFFSKAYTKKVTIRCHSD